jgi:prepilin-type N-terminal cleavage/methylation domain-containing protein
MKLKSIIKHMFMPKHKRQAGMTMVELVMTIAVTGIIVTFLGTAIYQIITVSGYGNDRLSAQHELQNAGSWFNLDVQGSVTAAAGSQLVLTLSDNTTITYSLVSNELRRSSGGPYMTLARNISSAVFSISNRLASMSLVCVPSWRDSASENGTYMAYLRPVVVIP